MLLTSSQVSVALSSGIVILFTTALFLSGYAIQQRTLRDLRAAIKPSPRPEPKIFLPDRFKKSTTELPDGTIIEVEDDGRAPTSSSRGGNNQKPLRGRARKQRQRQQQGGKDDEIVIEIKPTVSLPDGKGGQRPVTDKKGKEQDAKKEDTQSNKKKKLPEQKGKQQQGKDGKAQEDGGKKEGKKEKVVLPGPDAVPHPDDEEKLVSRAERRRLIKQELQRLSQGNERGYWQRRLW